MRCRSRDRSDKVGELLRPSVDAGETVAKDDEIPSLRHRRWLSARGRRRWRGPIVGNRLRRATRRRNPAQCERIAPRRRLMLPVWVTRAGGIPWFGSPARVFVALRAGLSADEAELLCHCGRVPVGQNGANLAFGEVNPEGALGAVALSGWLLRSHWSFHRSAMGDLGKQRVSF